MKIARVFPRRTKATPTDELAFIGSPPMLFPPKVDEVHVSVTFTWDILAGKRLAEEWSAVAPVKIGGPAMGTVGAEFTPGMYIAEGYTITSRGCPMRCPHCFAWKRDGVKVRELPIRDGWNLLDDNILRCSDDHIRAVFRMLARQERSVEFTGGLEAKALKDWHIERLQAIQPKQMFFAYDDAGDREPLFDAGRRMQEAGFTKQSHRLRCYVLIGMQGDTFEAAENRIREAWEAGFFPMAMLFIPESGISDERWESFQSKWANDYRVGAMLKARTK